MEIYPAIDLYGGKAVRLFKGDYDRMTVYSDHPTEIAEAFRAAGAKRMHVVDLEGAKAGSPRNLQTIAELVKTFAGFVEMGGGIRNMQTLEDVFSVGVDRVILGTAAVEDEAFLTRALETYEKKIAVGVDLKDGFVAIKGWTERSALSAEAFFEKMQQMGVATVICTDISKDGAMQGTNRALYRELSRKYTIELIASGGVSTMEDVQALAAMGLHGAIIGKAYYIGAIDLKQAIEVAI